MRTGISITVTPADRLRLEALVRDRNAPQKQVWRSEVVLLSADGAGTSEIKRRTGKSKTCVWRWQERFDWRASRVCCATRPDPPALPPLRSGSGERGGRSHADRSAGAATHWTADHDGEGGRHQRPARCSASGARTDCNRIAVRQFKLSNDPQLRRQAAATWSGFMSIRPSTPSCSRSMRRAQIQALDRTQPGLPLKKGRAGTMTHDYKRNGTTTLFAALDVLEGKVIGRYMQRHRHQEFIRFLNQIEARSPGRTRAVHVILDNYATHKHPEGPRMARSPPALHLPLHADLVPPGSMRSRASSPSSQSAASSAVSSDRVLELKAAINRFLVETNNEPKALHMDRRSRSNHRRG